MQKKRRYPAEWEKQQALLLCFPHNGNDWPGKYQAIQWVFVEFIKKVTTYQPVILIVADKKLKTRVSEMLIKAHVKLSQIKFILHKTNRNWMRDSGPIIVKNGANRREALHFNFNAWAKYKNYRLDRAVPHIVSKHLKIKKTTVHYKGKHIIFEGGAIDSNGKGTLLTTEECLLDPKTQVRNPGFTKADYETIFKEYLGITNTIWLKDGIKGDDTHGHIDDLARFINEDTIITVVESNKKDANYKPLLKNLAILKKSKLQNGKTPNIVELPMPQPLFFEKLRIPASYANFLIINKCVLVPTFNDPNDRIALDIIANCFPKRTVIGLSAIDLIWGFGAFHCLSQQIPT